MRAAIPRACRSLRDVVERKLRFVNRQRGSGTRLLIDRMLAEAQIEPSELEGFGNEEFTHPAVAATVASGGADAGFGLRAAAAEYGLAFVPLVRERYFLAVRAKDASKPPLIRLIDALKSPAFCATRASPARVLSRGGGLAHGSRCAGRRTCAESATALTTRRAEWAGLNWR